MATDWVHHNLQTHRPVLRTAEGNRRATDVGAWIAIADATPRVSEAGWRRSRTAGANGGAKRSVHAEIRGHVVASETAPGALSGDIAGLRRITYNPSTHAAGEVPTFRYADTSEPWSGSALVIVTGGYAYEVQR